MCIDNNSCTSIAEVALTWQHPHPRRLFSYARMLCIRNYWQTAHQACPSWADSSVPEHAGTQKAPRQPATQTTNQISHALCLKVARLLFRSSRSPTNALRVTSLHAAIVESNVMFRYCVVRWCVCSRRVHMLNPCPSCRPQDGRVSISPPFTFRLSNGDGKYYVPSPT